MNNRKKPWILRWMKGYLQTHMHGMITCREFDDFVGRYFDGELAQHQRALFERHIRYCRECREYLQAYQRAIEVGRAVISGTDVPLPEDVPEELIEAILKARNG